MRSWLCASVLIACLAGLAAAASGQAEAPEGSARVSELSLANLRPGKDTLAVAEKRYKAKFMVRDPARQNVREWRDPCGGRSIRLEVDSKEVVQSVTISALASRTPDCNEKKMEPLDQKGWITGRGLRLGDPEEIVYDLYGEPKSVGPFVKASRELELISYEFGWAGSDVPQVLKVLCARETGRVVEITLARSSP